MEVVLNIPENLELPPYWKLNGGQLDQSEVDRMPEPSIGDDCICAVCNYWVIPYKHVEEEPWKAQQRAIHEVHVPTCR